MRQYEVDKDRQHGDDFPARDDGGNRHEISHGTPHLSVKARRDSNGDRQRRRKRENDGGHDKMFAHLSCGVCFRQADFSGLIPLYFVEAAG
jgi:hypothetical protein